MPASKSADTANNHLPSPKPCKGGYSSQKMSPVPYFPAGQTARNRVRESPWQKENAKGTHVPATRVLNSTAGLSNHGYL